MASSLLLAFAVCCSVVSLSNAFLQPFFFRNNLRRKHEELFAEAAETAVEACQKDPLITENWFTQQLDQFNASDTRTYGQRYYVNWKYHKNETNDKQPVVFLNIGGEGEMSMKWNCWENYTYMQLAIQNEAIVVQLEHRFFGKNKDMPDLSTPNLVYLTTEQALADIATFIKAFSAANNLVNPRWVAFGGSYPGSLAAWLKVKYPDVTVGNVASSAPLWPKVNFWEYSDVMEKTIKATSEECYNTVGEAFKNLKSLTLTESGRTALTSWFNIEPKMDAIGDDITTFFGLVFGALQGVIQYTYDGASDKTMTKLTVRNACNIITDKTDPTLNAVQRLAKVYEFVAKVESGNESKKLEPMNIDYQWNLKNFTNTSLVGPGASYRGWFWLSCNEFGWLQTTDKGNSLFGDIISIGSYHKMCIDLFGAPMTTTYIEQQIAKATQTFGYSWTYKAKNVILPNGGFDPWSALGTNVSYPADHQISITTPGAAHCSDMYPSYTGEPEKLEETRKRVREEVNYYIKSAWKNPPAQPPTQSSPIISTSPPGNGAIGILPHCFLAVLPALAALLLKY